jgi:putative glycosyltransferase (TIGR04348 family)
VTAERWARLIGELGFAVELAEAWRGEPVDVLVALHARKSAMSIERFRGEHPAGALVVALTGTDLYADLAISAEARRSLGLADRLVALQPEAIARLPAAVQERARVILQSAEPAAPRAAIPGDRFDVAVLAHLRSVKDPFRAAWASALLPPRSRVRVRHAGAALDPGSEVEARRVEAACPRYRWHGPLPQQEALGLLAASRLLAVTSELEGGANVVSEALAGGVPVLSTAIPGSTGVLGRDYPGLFPVGDTAALAALLHRAETEPPFLLELEERCRRLAPRVSPERERESWRELLAEVAGERGRLGVKGGPQVATTAGSRRNASTRITTSSASS